MKTKPLYSLFDIIGPVMIGPSSSHTAGACRLARTARRIYGKTPRRVRSLLHGSFAHTYQGHGSDRAIAGGLLGFSEEDERLVQALDLAPAAGLDLSFEAVDLGPVHPNSIRFIFEDEGEAFSVTGASIGGGAIEITEINGIPVRFSGALPTLVLRYPDSPGMVLRAGQIAKDHGVNIATMSVTREEGIATMILELDEPLTAPLIEAFRSIPSLRFFKALEV